MSRKELSTYFTNDIVRIIQYKILPDKSKYLFLDEIKEIYLYSVFLICNKVSSNLSRKLLLKLFSFKTPTLRKDEDVS